MSAAGRGIRAAAVGVTAAVVAVTALVGIAVAEKSRQADRADLRAEVLAAGRQIAVDFAAYDYRHIDADFERVANEATGDFKQQFVRQAAGVRELIKKAEAVSTAEVASEGLADLAPTEATVVLALDRTIRNTSAPDGQQDSFGLSIALVKRNGRWLAAGVKPL